MSFSATASSLFVVHLYNRDNGQCQIWGPFQDAHSALVFFNTFLSNTHTEKDGWNRDIQRLMIPEGLQASSP